jgi:hypothetical protein
VTFLYPHTKIVNHEFALLVEALGYNLVDWYESFGSMIQWKQPTRCNLVTEFIIPPLIKVATDVCKPEAANTVRVPDDERLTARNMLSL